MPTEKKKKTVKAKKAPVITKADVLSELITEVRKTNSPLADKFQSKSDAAK
jgi:hypothetical protein